MDLVRLLIIIIIILVTIIIIQYNCREDKLFKEFGRQFNRSGPGMRIITEKEMKNIVVGQQVLSMAADNLITMDDKKVKVEFKIVFLPKDSATCRGTTLCQKVVKLSMERMKKITTELNLAEALVSKEYIKENLQNNLTYSLQDLGCELISLEIQNIQAN